MIPTICLLNLASYENIMLLSLKNLPVKLAIDQRPGPKRGGKRSIGIGHLDKIDRHGVGCCSRPAKIVECSKLNIKTF